MISVTSHIDIIKYLIPFISVIGICFLVLLVSMASFIKHSWASLNNDHFQFVKYIGERRRISRNRLSRTALNQLEMRKWRKGDEPETCAICLEDFVANDKLRVLPCKHGKSN